MTQQEMRFLSYKKCISELFIIINVIVFAASQTLLTHSERRVLEGFSGIQDGHVNLARSANLPNVLGPNTHLDLPGENGNQLPHPVVHGHSDLIPQRSGAHVDLPGEHGNESPIPLVHRTGADAHVDIPGQHGNQLSVPVLHADNGIPRFSRRPDLFRQTGNPLPFSVVHGQGGTHVDLPGEHGNLSPHPVVHRGSGGGGAHVDLPGQHGNVSPHPVVHRQDGTHVDLPGGHGNISPHPVVHRGTFGGGAHVDLPGQHGNVSPHPVIHRGNGGGGAHVDLPGQHGNVSPHPTVHRQGGTHVDLPGEHGNLSPHPVVHRGNGGGGAHVDLPGQHGNVSPHPVIHRGTIGGGAHVDLPGQHGNVSPHPTVHRQGGTHVDLPGEHGNLSPHPVVHRGNGGGGAHVDLPGQHGNVSPVPVVHRDQTNTHIHAHHERAPQGHEHIRNGFIDPITGTPVVLQGQNNGLNRLPHVHSDSSSGDTSLSFESSSNSRFPPGLSTGTHPDFLQPPTVGPFGLPFMPGPGDPRFGVHFRPGLFGPPPFLLPPEARRMRGGRRMRRLLRGPLIMGGLPPPFPPPFPPPRPTGIGLRGLLAGAIGNLFGRLLRQ